MHLRTDVSVLYCNPRGPYPGLVADWWDEKRDARLYAGPNPVVAHPPCNRWSVPFAFVNQTRYGLRVGDDGGCFEAALRAVRAYGGVLEHPAGTHAWKHFRLPRPRLGQWSTAFVNAGWVAEVSQVAYGHPAEKRTWLYYVGSETPAPADWTRPKATGKCGGFRDGDGAHRLRRIRDRHASATPVAFARWLIDLAAAARPQSHASEARA